MSKELQRITGHANSQMQQFKQIGTVDTTINFYGFKPVGANVTLSVLTNMDGSSALTYNSSGIYYQNVYYPGNYKRILPASGEVVLYLSEQ